MNILAFDTTSPLLSVAARNSEGKTVEFNYQGIFGHAEHFLPLLDGVLRQLKLTLPDIQQVMTGTGPGSFTGARVGFAFLKGLTAGRSLPVSGISSLELIARNAVFADGDIAVMVNARREKVYAAFFRFKKNGLARTAEDQVLTPEAFMKKLKPGTRVMGDALRVYGDKIRRHSKTAVLLPEKFWYPRAVNAFDAGVQSENLKGNYLPNYLRLSEPEEKKNERHYAC